MTKKALVFLTARSVNVEAKKWDQWKPFCVETFGSISERIRLIIDSDLQGTPLNNSVSVEVLEKRLADLAAEKRVLERQLKEKNSSGEWYLGHKYDDLENVAEKLGLQQYLENLDEIALQLLAYEPSQQDSFGSDDISVFIRYLRVIKLKNDNKIALKSAYVTKRTAKVIQELPLDNIEATTASINPTVTMQPESVKVEPIQEEVQEAEEELKVYRTPQSIQKDEEDDED